MEANVGAVRVIDHFECVVEVQALHFALQQNNLRQYLYFCASKVSTFVQVSIK